MNLLSKLFGKSIGFRWSLYIVRDENRLVYAMHENSVIGIVGYVMGFYANGAKPVTPWSLYLNFNHKHQTIKLGPEHFTPDGENITSALIHAIEIIDPGWKVKGGEPIFVEAATKKRIRISNSTLEHIDLQKILDNFDKPRDPTFFSIMDEVFGKASEMKKVIEVYILDPNGNYSAMWEIGKDISLDIVQQAKDPSTGALYAITTYEKGKPQTNVCKMELWLKLKAQFDAIEEEGADAMRSLRERYPDIFQQRTE